MKQKFNGKDGKVVFIKVESISEAYPEGTLKVEVTVYPVGIGSYSSFIYTDEQPSVIENSLAKIAEQFLTDKKSSYGSQEISDRISNYLNPVFPKSQSSVTVD